MKTMRWMEYDDDRADDENEERKMHDTKIGLSLVC